MKIISKGQHKVALVDQSVLGLHLFLASGITLGRVRHFYTLSVEVEVETEPEKLAAAATSCLMRRR